MKRLPILLTFLLFISALIACNSSQKMAINLDDYESFGQAFEVDNIKTPEQAAKVFKNLEIGDSVKMQFEAPIKEVCAKKGCWMYLDLGNEDQSFVKFQDYGFFVPKDAAGREAILNGWAHRKETSVERLRHYAEDAGKSEEEIMAITEPEIEYFFMADGVWLKKQS